MPQVFSYSNFNREAGEVGVCTAAALDEKHVQWAKVKPVKEKAPSKQYGVPAEPGPDLGIEYRYSIGPSKSALVCRSVLPPELPLLVQTELSGVEY